LINCINHFKRKLSSLQIAQANNFPIDAAYVAVYIRNTTIPTYVPYVVQAVVSYSGKNQREGMESKIYFRKREVNYNTSTMLQNLKKSENDNCETMKFELLVILLR
jgi:hypothetical protein